MAKLTNFSEFIANLQQELIKPDFFNRPDFISSFERLKTEYTNNPDQQHFEFSVPDLEVELALSRDDTESLLSIFASYRQNDQEQVETDSRLHESEPIPQTPRLDNPELNQTEQPDSLPTAGVPPTNQQAPQTTNQTTSASPLPAGEIVRNSNIVKLQFLDAFRQNGLELSSLNPDVEQIIAIEVAKLFQEKANTYKLDGSGNLSVRDRLAVRNEVMKRLRSSTEFLAALQIQTEQAQQTIIGKNNQELPKEEQVLLGKILQDSQVQGNLSKQEITDVKSFVEAQVKHAYQLSDLPTGLDQDIQGIIEAASKNLLQNPNFLNTDGSLTAQGKKALTERAFYEIEHNPLVSIKIIANKLTQTGKSPDPNTSPASKATGESILNTATASSNEETDEQATESFNKKNQELFQKEVKKIALFSGLTTQESLEYLAKEMPKGVDLKNFSPDQLYEFFPSDAANQIVALGYQEQQQILQLVVAKQAEGQKIDIQKLLGKNKELSAQDHQQIAQKLHDLDMNGFDGKKFTQNDLRKILGDDVFNQLSDQQKRTCLFAIQDGAIAVQGAKFEQAGSLQEILARHGIKDEKTHQALDRLLKGGALSGLSEKDFLRKLAEIESQYDGLLKSLGKNVSLDQKRQIQDLLASIKTVKEAGLNPEVRYAIGAELNKEQASIAAATGSYSFLQLSQEPDAQAILYLSQIADAYGTENVALALTSKDPLAIDSNAYKARAVWYSTIASSNPDAFEEFLSSKSWEGDTRFDDPAFQDLLANSPILDNPYSDSNPHNSSGRLQGLSRARAKAKLAIESAKKLATQLGKKAAIPIAAGVAAGAGVALLGKLLGLTAQVAVGAGAGAGIGGVIGFFTAGPVGALIGGAIGTAIGGGTGWALGGGGSLFESADLTQGLLNAKQAVQGVTQPAAAVASTAAQGTTSAAVNIATANFSGAVSQMAVSLGTTLGLGIISTVSVLGLMTILIAFMPDADISYLGPQAGEFSRYVEVSKNVNKIQVDNITEGGPRETLEYTITITPKNGFTITPTDISDTFSYLGKSPPRENPAPPLPDSTEKVISQLPLNTSISSQTTLTYQVELDRPMKDLLLVNTFNLRFTAIKDNENIDDVIRASASVKIGNPELGCFEFGESGRRLDYKDKTGEGAFVTKAWSAEEINRTIKAYYLRAGSNVDFESRICTGRDITIYRVPKDPSNRGFHGYIYNENTLIMFDPVYEGTESNLEYTFVHELGHIMDSRNSRLRLEFIDLFSGRNLHCFTYPFNCSQGEAFAEGVVLYVVHNTKTFGGQLYDFDGLHPRHYDWMRRNIFGGIEY